MTRPAAGCERGGRPRAVYGLDDVEERSPWALDWKRQTARSVLYWASPVKSRLARGHVGWLAPCLVVVEKA